MAKVVTCPICGNTFETGRPNKKYCSFTCKEAGRQLRRMKWEAANPHYNAEYMKKYRTAQKEGAQHDHDGTPGTHPHDLRKGHSRYNEPGNGGPRKKGRTCRRG